MKNRMLVILRQWAEAVKKYCFAAFALVVSRQVLAGEGAFDDGEYTWSMSWDSPMSTVAGLTDWAASINEVYGLTTIIVTFVFFAVSIPLVFTIFKFRAGDRDLSQEKPPKQVHGNAVLEFTWTIVPVILLLFIAVPTWEGIFSRPQEAPEGSLRVKVIGHQWWWEFQYPDLGITTANELHLPENTPVFYELVSADVIHSFWVPKFGGKVDVLPGVGAENSMFYTTPPLADPSRTGGEYYQGQCVELCGLSHALMRFDAVLHSNEEFTAWVENFKKPPVVASSLEEQGEQLFVQCQACHSISGTPSQVMEDQMLALDPPIAKQGPNLTGFGDRRTLGAGTRKNTHENFVKWVRNPQSIKPGAIMTSFAHLSEAEMDAIAAYLRYSTVKEF